MMPTSVASLQGCEDDGHPPRERRSEVLHMPEDEITELHARLAFGIMQTGLTGHALDEAISAAFTRCVQIIERGARCR